MKTTGKAANADTLAYLEKMANYPFDPKIDPLFVEELVTDFGASIDILEETKAFHWFHIDQATSRLKSPRLALRRWLKKAKTPHHLKTATKP